MTEFLNHIGGAGFSLLLIIGAVLMARGDVGDSQRNDDEWDMNPVNPLSPFYEGD
jgi:hypothetical protein